MGSPRPAPTNSAPENRQNASSWCLVRTIAVVRIAVAAVQLLNVPSRHVKHSMWANSSTFNYPDTTPGTAAAAALLPGDAQKLIITNSIAIWHWQRLAVLCNLISDGHVLLWLSETILSFKNVNQHKPPHNNIYPVYHCACYDWEAVNKGLCCYHVTVPASCVLGQTFR